VSDQTLVSDDAWLAFLDVEQAMSLRANFASVAITTWAFNAGRRSVTRGE
jgi:hypothetical protein